MRLSGNKRISVLPLCLLVFFTIAFIFTRSAKSAAASATESASVFERLSPLFAFLFGEGQITHFAVRKIAHVTEFFLLGAELSVLWISLGGKQRFAVPFFSLSCALADETVQIFSGRGSSVADVWLDLGGALLGGATVAAFRFLHAKARKRRRT